MSENNTHPKLVVKRQANGKGVTATVHTKSRGTPYLNLNWDMAYQLADQIIDLIAQQRKE